MSVQTQLGPAGAEGEEVGLTLGDGEVVGVGVVDGLGVIEGVTEGEEDALLDGDVVGVGDGVGDDE